MTHPPLTQLSEADLLWIGGFADALRALEPRFAADGCGDELDRLARDAFEQPALRGLPPGDAALTWQRAADRRG